MSLEKTVEFEVIEYIKIINGKYLAGRTYIMKLKGSSEERYRMVDSKPPTEDTDSLIHLMQRALFIAKRVYPDTSLRNLKCKFTVTQHRTIVSDEKIDVTEKREERYQEIIQKIFSGEYPRFYETLEKELGK